MGLPYWSGCGLLGYEFYSMRRYVCLGLGWESHDSLIMDVEMGMRMRMQMENTWEGKAGQSRTGQGKVR